MKELSIEEKSYEAYTELINRLEDVKNAIKKQNYGIAMNILDKPYPEFQITTSTELKESEDRKIKSDIQYAVRCAYGDNSSKTESILAWLDEQKTSEEALQYLRENHSSSEMSDFQAAMNIAVAKAYDKGYSDGFKKGKKKSIDDLTQQEAMDVAVAKCFEQGEQKPFDKIKPKFHKGDWIITNKNHIWYVDETPETTSYLYRLINQNGKVEVAEFEVVDKKARLWTIQDAKDGDVLFTSSTASHETFILKSIDEKGNAKCYFAYDSEDGFREGKYHFIGSATNCKPATKEQRDLLFAKMKEAGYEWNAEKKELKKKNLIKKR